MNEQDQKERKKPSFLRRLLSYRIILFDGLIAAASLPITLFLRFDGEVERIPGSLPVWGASFCLIAVATELCFGAHKTVWRYVSLSDLIRIVKVSFFSIGSFLFLLLMTLGVLPFPRSVPVVHGFLLVGLLAGSRAGYRFLTEGYVRRRLSGSFSQRKHVLLMHTGDETDLFLRYQQRDQKSPYHVVGLVDQDDRHIRRTVRGVPVIGRLEDLSKVLPTQPTCPEELILTSDEVPQWSLKKIISEIEPLGLKVVRLPFMRTLQLHQGITACPIAVEELLGRSPQVLNVSIVEEVLRGRSVLVTGAGGSIGSELVRQLIAYAPKRLLLLDSSEYLLYRIDKEIVESLDAKTEKIPCIGDVRDAPHLYTLFETYRPDVVFHAAALKHVPLVEKNPAEGVLTNVMGTRCIADACHTYGTSLMVQISTDKAVAPKSVMGATKRLAELYCQTLDITSATRFVTVRFGNVLGSSGSVVPLFEEQIAQGGPVTVTHAEMVRYFMTVPEAVRLILLSAAAGRQKSDVGGQIFVLEMGAPVRIIDLAHQMIRLKGLTPGKDIKIIYTGVREGEKLYENLFDEQESPAPSGFHGIHLASSHPVRADVLYPLLDELVALAQNRSDPEVAARVREIIAILRS